MENTEQLKTETLDLLNRLAILLKDVPELERNTKPDYDDYASPRLEAKRMSYDDPNSINKDEVFLQCVAAYAKRVLSEPFYHALENEEQYYNSNCY